VDVHSATIEDDTHVLGPWSDAFGAICGQPVARAPLDAADPSAGDRLTFPRVFQPIELIGGTGHFRQHPAMAEQVQRMGFAWDDAGRVMTVPAPGAFNARLARAGLPGSGFSMAYSGETTPRMPLGTWLLRYMHGVITLSISAPAFYERLVRTVVPPHERDQARWALMSVAHDLSVHALNYHLIPHAAISDLAERIRTAIPERYAAWSLPETVVPLTLTYFYDNDFNRYTYAVWCRCERPGDFAARFQAPRNYDQLIAALETRIAETKAGRGDVPSGDFDDMGPLAETRFEIA
jgi:hypothetical protein